MDRLWSRIDRKALLVTAVCIVVWRVLDQISVVDITGRFLNTRLDLYSQPGFFAAIGPNSIRFSAYSIEYLGIGPYIQVLVLMSLIPFISARVRNLLAQPAGLTAYRRAIRVIALLWAMGAAYGWTMLAGYAGALPNGIDWSARLVMCLELTAGTAVLIFLADALDEHGLGFGYGALIFYALGFVEGEVHRIGGYLATTPSIEALYKPAAFSLAFTIGLTIAGVASLLAVRRIPSPFEDERKRRGTIDIRLLTSGVLRPPTFAFALMTFPALVANFLYVQTNPQLASWFTLNWGPYGNIGWLDVIYLVVEATLVALLGVVVTAIDVRIMPPPPPTYRYFSRLGVLGGLFLAIAVVAVPVANHYLTKAAGALIPVSGLDVLIVVAVILAVVRAIEGYKTSPPLTASPTGLP